MLAPTVNVAETFKAELTVTKQGPVPEHPPPDQPANPDPGSGVALSLTAVPQEKFAVHVAPQSMPAGADVIEPRPVPDFDTVTALLPTKVVATSDTSSI